MALMKEGQKLFPGGVYTVNVFHRPITFLIGPEVSAHFFTAKDTELSQKEVYEVRATRRPHPPACPEGGGGERGGGGASFFPLRRPCRAAPIAGRGSVLSPPSGAGVTAAPAALPPCRPLISRPHLPL